MSESSPAFPLVWKGRRLVTEFPEKTAQLRVEAVHLQSQTLYIVPSPLCCWGLTYLLQRLPPDSKVLLYEADAQLATLSQPYWPAEARVCQLTADKPTEWTKFVTGFDWSSIRRVSLLPLSPGWLLAPQAYRDIESRLVALVAQAWSNRLTSVEFGNLWLRRLVANVSTKRWVWPDWGSDTVLVCGAGTTLERVLENWKPEYRSRLRILAADTALRPLAQAGIRPDAVVILETQHHNLGDFVGFGGSGIPVFADLTADPAATHAMDGPRAWFSGQFAGLSLFKRWKKLGISKTVPQFAPFGSVGLAAVEVAWKLTRGSVILAGLDFSFPAGKTHARGAPNYASFWSTTDRLTGSEPPGSGVRPGVHQARVHGWLTTGVLEGYGQLLNENLAKAQQRTFFWGPSPSGLSVQELDPTGEWLRDAPVASSLTIWRPEPATGAFQQWLAEEFRLLEEFLAALDSPVGPERDQRLLVLSQQLDHLSFSFPDPSFRATTDWLARMKASVVWWHHRLSQQFGYTT